MVGDDWVTNGRRVLTIFLSIHDDVLCSLKKGTSPPQGVPEMNRKISVCGEDGSTGICLLLGEGRKQVNRSEEPVTEDLVVETGYVAGEFVKHSFT